MYPDSLFRTVGAVLISDLLGMHSAGDVSHKPNCRLPWGDSKCTT